MKGFSPIEGRASTAGECLAAMREWPLAAHVANKPLRGVHGHLAGLRQPYHRIQRARP